VGFTAAQLGGDPARDHIASLKLSAAVFIRTRNFARFLGVADDMDKRLGLHEARPRLDGSHGLDGDDRRPGELTL
jgi:hypothetical protein